MENNLRSAARRIIRDSALVRRGDVFGEDPICFKDLL